jgi:hypothetical protein
MKLKVKAPGVRSMPAAQQAKFMFEVDNIGSSNFVWDVGNPGGKVTVNGDYITATATYTGLPQNNTDFGLKKARVKYGSNNAMESKFEVFFPRDAKNNPGLTNTSSAENWFYYWNQFSGSSAIEWLDDERTKALIAKVPAINLWATYAGPRDSIHFSSALRTTLNFSHTRRDGSNKLITGVDTFRTVVVHEQRHVTQIIENNQLPFYNLVSGVSRNAAASGWSFNVNKKDPRYNHFSIGPDNIWKTIDDVNLDPDNDDLGTNPQGADFDAGSGGVEPQAWASETNVEHDLARIL